MKILDREKSSNLILNLLYLRDYTSYDRNSFGVRLNKTQEEIEDLLTRHEDCSINL